MKVQLPCQHHHIGKLCIKLQRFTVDDVQLCGEMHLHAHAACIDHHRHISCDDRRECGLFSRIHNPAHQHHIILVDDRVYSEVTFYIMLATDLCDLMKIINREVIGGSCTHIQPFNTEVDSICPTLYGCCQRFV